MHCALVVCLSFYSHLREEAVLGWVPQQLRQSMIEAGVCESLFDQSLIDALGTPLADPGWASFCLSLGPGLDDREAPRSKWGLYCSQGVSSQSSRASQPPFTQVHPEGEKMWMEGHCHHVHRSSVGWMSLEDKICHTC